MQWIFGRRRFVIDGRHQPSLVNDMPNDMGYMARGCDFVGDFGLEIRRGFTEIDLWMHSRLIFGGISVGFLVGNFGGNFRLIILIWGGFLAGILRNWPTEVD